MKKDKISFLGGARLREERERLGLLQDDAERLWGVSRVTWGKYERNEGTPGADALTAFLNSGGDVIYVLTGVRTTRPTIIEQDRAGYSNDNLSNQEQQLLENFSACSDEGKAAILATATALAKAAAKG